MPEPATPASAEPKTFDIATGRLAYAGGALSALGVAVLLAALSLLFGVPPIDTSFSIDQIIWLVAIFILVFSLRDLAIAVATMAMGPMLLFRCEAAGVRIGGPDQPLTPWSQVAAVGVRRDELLDMFEMTVRRPAPSLDWFVAKVYGLDAIARTDTLTYAIRCQRLALSPPQLSAGLQPFADRLPKPDR